MTTHDSFVFLDFALHQQQPKSPLLGAVFGLELNWAEGSLKYTQSS